MPDNRSPTLHKTEITCELTERFCQCKCGMWETPKCLPKYFYAAYISSFVLLTFQKLIILEVVMTGSMNLALQSNIFIQSLEVLSSLQDLTHASSMPRMFASLGVVSGNMQTSYLVNYYVTNTSPTWWPLVVLPVNTLQGNRVEKNSFKYLFTHLGRNSTEWATHQIFRPPNFHQKLKVCRI